jgi:hypothetical protein
MALRLMEVINFVDHLMAIFFMASSVVHVWEFISNLSAVGGNNQLH